MSQVVLGNDNVFCITSKNLKEQNGLFLFLSRRKVYENPKTLEKV